MASDPAQLLARSTVFGILPRDELVGLVRSGHEQRFAQDELLFRDGDPCDQIQVLLVGQVRLWRLSDDGHVLVLRVCGAGEVLGQMSALSPDGAHSVNATTDNNCQVLAFPARAFRELLEQHPALAVQLASVLAERVRGLSDELEAIKFSSIGQRVLWWLQRHGAGHRELKITHQAIADQVGATRENVSRVLGLLRDRQLVSLGRGRIEILDHDALERAEV